MMKTGTFASWWRRGLYLLSAIMRDNEMKGMVSSYNHKVCYGADFTWLIYHSCHFTFLSCLRQRFVLIRLNEIAFARNFKRILSLWCRSCESRTNLSLKAPPTIITKSIKSICSFTLSSPVWKVHHLSIFSTFFTDLFAFILNKY